MRRSVTDSLFAEVGVVHRGVSCRRAVIAATLLTLAALGATGARAEEEMTFEPVSGNALAAVGRITERTPALFLDAVHRTGGRGTTVYLDSPGGGVVASMVFGSLMRQVGATAIVAKASSSFFGGGGIQPGECFSACVYALIGASRRVIPRQSLVGIHRMFLSIDGGQDVTAYASRQQRSAAVDIRSRLSQYTARMGVSPEMIAQAERTPSDNIHVLTPTEIRRYRVGLLN